MAPRASTPRKKAPAGPSRKGIGGRKPVITAEVQQALCDMLRLGMYEEPACDAVGIGYRTFGRWKAEGEEAHRLVLAMEEEGRAAPKLSALQERQRQFWLALMKATGGGEAGYLRIVAAAATGGATAVEVTRTYENVKQPDGKVARQMVGEVRKERELMPDPRMALEVLARRFPNNWARTERVELTGRGGKPIESQVNVGDQAVNDPRVKDAVDHLLNVAAGGSTTTEEGL